MNQDRREYSEQLPLGAKLIVRPTGWHISYYFSGPDMRYSGTSIEIPGKDVGAHIDAFAANWNEYLRLKGQIPPGGSFSIEGACHMTINVGGYWDGVCIRAHHGAMNTLERIELAIASYQYAQKRSIAVQEALNQLDEPPEFQLPNTPREIDPYQPPSFDDYS